MMRLVKFACITITATLLQGCIASTIIGLAAETIEAGVEVTSAVVGGVVDAVTPNDKDKADK